MLATASEAIADKAETAARIRTTSRAVIVRYMGIALVRLIERATLHDRIMNGAGGDQTTRRARCRLTAKTQRLCVQLKLDALLLTRSESRPSLIS